MVTLGLAGVDKFVWLVTHNFLCAAGDSVFDKSKLAHGLDLMGVDN